MFIFKVEDGTGYKDSTSYASVEYADEYIDFFYDALQWNELSIEEKEKKLMLATKYIDSSVRWQAGLKRLDQALQWPRYDFPDSSGRLVSSRSVPQPVIDATVMIAYSSLTHSLSNDSYSITEESFGDSRDKYATPVTVYFNPYIGEALLNLSNLGYAQSNSAYVYLQRS